AGGTAAHAERRARGEPGAALIPQPPRGEPMLSQDVVAERDPYRGRIRRAPQEPVDERDLLRQRDLPPRLRELRVVDPVPGEHLVDEPHRLPPRQPQPQLEI